MTAYKGTRSAENLKSESEKADSDQLLPACPSPRTNSNKNVYRELGFSKNVTILTVSAAPVISTKSPALFYSKLLDGRIMVQAQWTGIILSDKLLACLVPTTFIETNKCPAASESLLNRKGISSLYMGTGLSCDYLQEGFCEEKTRGT